ncbi:hypothetical protein ACHRVW_07320 [Flavobacterium collinsii]|uniref:hypothetical protein n=1 Tax=Flavobacterium collinsii TaxID=1114861 RepID=UPI003757D5C0
MNHFDVILESLKNQKKSIEEKIYLEIGNKNLLIIEKEKIKQAIYWLSLIGNLQIENCRVEKSITIPDLGFCDARLVLDPESDNPEMWSDFKINDETVLLDSGDIILKLKKR